MSYSSNNIGDITDPSDFRKSSIPALAELDVLERCYICKEFFNAPVITSCHHTFCSKCIREYLITNNLCPLCKTEVFESNLKRDVLLEEIVGCYKRIRPHLLHHLTTKVLNNGVEEAEVTKSDTKNEKKRTAETEEVSMSSSTQVKQQKIEKVEKVEKVEEPHNEVSNQDQVECPVCTKKMTVEKLQRTHLDACLSGDTLDTSNSSSSTLRITRSNKSSLSSFFRNTSNKSSSPSSPMQLSSSSSEKELPENLGHKDFYFNETSKQPHKEVKRLPKLDFVSLSTAKLKEKLSQLHIPTTGSRHQLELRYNQYFVLYNSNIDSNHPVSERTLRQKLHKWELSHSSFGRRNGIQEFSNSTSGSISHRSITDKDFSVSEWMAVYGPEFKELVRQARKSLARSRGRRKGKGKEESVKAVKAIDNLSEEKGTDGDETDADANNISEPNMECKVSPNNKTTVETNGTSFDFGSSTTFNN
ncbi:RAD18 [Candida oxycetoniae]|uniref:Postreplication repair E3 ubiquitin-protein ligase RAD18 n=1 Tax=Candida oxycetoniae TaxID=497107 RepID=A0AAI9SWU1_9ASCO|nr:RAD18 [Candida oxycetoniae]KAI3404219.2 RAD18 [Candida oxycetoniae]